VENKIIFHENIDDDPSDFTRLQDFAEASIDHLVADAVTPLAKYAGFDTAKSAVTQITVQPGRLYSGGKVYSSGSTAWTKDFITQLPVAGKRIAAIVTWGSEVDTDVRPRQFLINAETRQAEPQAVAMVHSRLANLQVQVGNEAPDPTAPLVDAGYTIIALVTLTPTGVSDVAMVTDNNLVSIQDHEDRIEDLELFEETAGFQIKTLTSDIASIKAGQGSTLTPAQWIRAQLRIATLESKVGISATAIDSDANYFLTTDKSQLDDPLSSVKVEEGIRFPDAAANVAALQIFNPLDPYAMIKNGVLFPAYDREAWLSTGARTAETQIISFSQQSFQMVQKMMSRQRIRYGEQFTVCTNSYFWQTGTFDPMTGIFSRNGEQFQAAFDLNGMPIAVIDANNLLHTMVRLRQIWTDTVTEPYWDNITTPVTVTGAQVAETWLQGQDMWLDAVGLMFTRLADVGTCHVAVVEVTKYGLPSIDDTIAQTTIQRVDMKLNAETTVPLQPTFLKAGKRYAVVLTTAADHWVATVNGTGFTQGTFFYILDGAYAQGDATRDLWMKLYRAKPRAQRTVINLAAQQLVGGILAIDILAGAISPSGTSLSYEVQVGATWYNLNDVDIYILGQGGVIPPLLPLRAVFNGTGDIMPCLNLADSTIKVSRPATAARHISKTRTLPAASTQVRVIERYEFFDPAYHTASCQLRTGAGFATVASPSSVTTVIDPNDGAYEKTYIFNLGAAVTAFRKDTQIGTQTAQKTFHVGWQKDYAQ
jgi:hypothetical protein